jgi:hypothetical protein
MYSIYRLTSFTLAGDFLSLGCFNDNIDKYKMQLYLHLFWPEIMHPGLRKRFQGMMMEAEGRGGGGDEVRM